MKPALPFTRAYANGSTGLADRSYCVFDLIDSTLWRKRRCPAVIPSGHSDSEEEGEGIQGNDCKRWCHEKNPRYSQISRRSAALVVVVVVLSLVLLSLEKKKQAVPITD